MRKRKTHSTREFVELKWYAKCGRIMVVGDTLAQRPTCLNCQRVLKARKGK